MSAILVEGRSALGIPKRRRIDRRSQADSRDKLWGEDDVLDSNERKKKIRNCNS